MASPIVLAYSRFVTYWFRVPTFCSFTFSAPSIKSAKFVSPLDPFRFNFFHFLNSMEYKTIDGIWQLSEWNGRPLAEGQYCYLVINCTEHAFTMYQNLIARLVVRLSVLLFWVRMRIMVSGMMIIISLSMVVIIGVWYGSFRKLRNIPCDEVPVDILAGSQAL